MALSADHPVVNNLTLITGGARSGKSAFAEQLASTKGGSIYYVATMEELVEDLESAQRIARHRSRRPAEWTTVERPLDVHEEIDAIPEGAAVCLIDCLSLYVSNLLLCDRGYVLAAEELESCVSASVNELLRAITRRPSIDFIIVTNEVGWGIVPENGLARVYRDLLGISNQLVAACSNHVWLCCSGLKLKLK